MTLAPPRPVDTAPASSAGAAAPVVTALVVTHRDPTGVREVLEALLAQTLRPDEVLLLDRTGGAVVPGSGTEDDDPDAGRSLADVLAACAHDLPVTVVASDPRAPARRAAYRAVLDHEPDPAVPTLLWFLPVGTHPEPAALVRLVDAWRRSPSTGVVGPKHVDADAPHRLRAVSIRTTRGGRLLARPVPGEPDQGQYDTTSDVLAVPFAGSLVERDLLVGLRGWETTFGDVGADLDLGWRAQSSGRRVVVVPSSRVRSRAGVAVATATTGARRRAARRVAMARAPWWSTPFLALWVAVSSVFAAVTLLLLKRPRGAWAEIASLSSLDPVRGWRARWRTRGRPQVRRRDLHAVFEPRRAVLTSWGDSVHHALVPPQPPIGDEAADLNPRSWLAKVVRHPGVVAVLAALATTVAAARSLGLDIVTGLGNGLTGGELVGSRADAGSLWHAWRDGWSGAGLGGPDQAGPASALLAAPAWLVDHLPLVPDPVSPGGVVVALTLLLGMPAAAASAYLALRVAATRRWVRTLGAVAWACSGPAAAAVAQGRLGAVVALVLLPAVAAGLWLVAARRSTATSAFATALAVTLLGAFAPVLAGLAVLLALGLALVRSRVRVHALVTALVPAVVLAPWVLVAGATSWPAVVAGTGLAQWGGTPPPAWRLALLDPGGPGAPLVWTAVPLVVLGLAGLVRGRSWRGTPAALAAFVPALLALALLAPRLRLGTVPSGLQAAGEAITPWAGTMLLPLVLVLVLATAHGLDALPVHALAQRPRVLARVLAGTAVAGVLAVLAGVVVATLGTGLTPWRDPRPAVAVDQAEGAFATRSLFVEPGDRGAAYRFVGREDARLVRTLPGEPGADAAVAADVTGLLGAVPGSERLVGATAADLLAVRGGQVPEVVRRLDATDGLQRISPKDGWELWRLSPTGRQSEALVAPPRLRMESEAGTALVVTTGAHAATTTRIDAPEGARLVVAEPAGWAEHAVVEVDRRVLRPVADAASPTYELPTGPGTLTVTLTDPQRWWHLGQVLALAVLAFLAVPFGRRETRVAGR
jgi:GT2 family glycosyltransferase